MKFTPEQIEEIRADIGGTSEGAEQLAKTIARMCAEHIRSELESSDPDGLRDGDAHAEGMERAASLLDADE